MIVLDASCVLELILATPKGRRVGNRIASPDETLHAPHLIDLEVLQVLRRYVRLREITSERAREALEDFSQLRIERYAHALLLWRIWELRDNTTAYDAAYLALAEVLGAQLITCDSALQGVPQALADVEVL